MKNGIDLKGHYDFENYWICIEFSKGTLWASGYCQNYGSWNGDELPKEETRKLYLAMKEYFEGEDGKDVQG